MAKNLHNELLYVRAPLDTLPSIRELDEHYDNSDDKAACIIRHLVKSSQTVNNKNKMQAEKLGMHKANPDDYFSTKNIGPDIKRTRIPRAMRLHNLIQKNPTAFVGFNMTEIKEEVAK